MSAFSDLTSAQRRTFIAAFLGWTLDAFDFFLLTFVLTDLSREFAAPIPTIAFGITITLMLRWVGALIFGYFADKYGRRTPLMVNIVFFSVIELATAFSPNLTVFFILRGLYGIAMGGEWGVGAALALETLPAERRGIFSGILQEGYALGYLTAALAFYGIFSHTGFGWRGLFLIGVLPALLVFYIRRNVPESPAWLEGKARISAAGGNLWSAFLKRPGLFAYVILLMAAFNFMSHGSQDLYPTFLRAQRGYTPGFVALVTVIANLGAIAGGTFFGAISQRIGRRRAIVTAALIGMLMIPLWIGAPNTALLALGAFLIQFFVQGAWGVIPIHLNELSPSDVRGTFPGFTYQLGNLITAYAAQLEATFAVKLPGPGGTPNYAIALAIIMVIVFAAVAVTAALGSERRAVELATAE